MRWKDVVGTLDQETSEVGVAGLGNAQLRIMVSRLAAFRLKAKIATDVATLPEAFLVAKSEYEGKCRDGSNAVNLLQGLCLWVLGLADYPDLTIILFDPQRHLRDLFEHRIQCLCEYWRHHRQAALCEAAGRLSQAQFRVPHLCAGSAGVWTHGHVQLPRCSVTRTRRQLCPGHDECSRTRNCESFGQFDGRLFRPCVRPGPPRAGEAFITVGEPAGSPAVIPPGNRLLAIRGLNGPMYATVLKPGAPATYEGLGEFWSRTQTVFLLHTLIAARPLRQSPAHRRLAYSAGGLSHHGRPIHLDLQPAPGATAPFHAYATDLG